VKDIIALSPLFLSQITVSNDTWERLGFGALGFAATVYLFKLMQKKDDARQKIMDEAAKKSETARQKREDENAADRNRLLEENNRLNAQLVSILLENQKSLLTQGRDFKSAVEDGQRSIKELIRTYNKPGPRPVTVENDSTHPIPTEAV
jgi:hypothetical protein